VAETIYHKFTLQKVIFVTAHCPPHKSVNDLTPAEDRLAMVEHAIKDIPHFESSRIEMERGCPSYAGDTIEALKNLLGEMWDIYFITGLDALLTIINWDRAKTYPGLCHFIAATRPGYNRDKIEAEIPPAFTPFITIIEEPRLAISSTGIRSRVRAQKPITNMVPNSVENYIVTRGLYR
jgi:nicotinate-nucleotide adenylyltransferase